MNTNQFCGAESLEEYEAMRLKEPIILDMDMINRGDGPLFMSIYDRLNQHKTSKRKDKEITKSDAEIVDNIFKSKLEKKKAEKPKGLAAFSK